MSKINIDWLVDELKLFIQQEGHSYVPFDSENKALIKMVKEVRKLYANGKLCEDDVNRLEKLGFIWKLGPLEYNFFKFFNKLKDFKLQHGHCNVPRSFSDSYLINKVLVFRSMYKKNKVPEALVNILKNIGFDFNRKEQIIKSWNLSWKQFIRQLKEFKKEHGHCNVPQNFSNKWLAGKVLSVRQDYHYGRLKNNRKIELDKLGFIWQPQKDRQKSIWDKTFDALVLFQQKHGHCDVPQIYEPNPWLGRRVNTIRSMFNKGRVPNETIMQLHKIGFFWDVKK